MMPGLDPAGAGSQAIDSNSYGGCRYARVHHHPSEQTTFSYRLRGSLLESRDAALAEAEVPDDRLPALFKPSDHIRIQAMDFSMLLKKIHLATFNTTRHLCSSSRNHMTVT